jgi:hypothetical protein
MYYELAAEDWRDGFSAPVVYKYRLGPYAQAPLLLRARSFGQAQVL